MKMVGFWKESERDYLRNPDLAQSMPSLQTRVLSADSAQSNLQSQRLQLGSKITTRLNCFSGDETTQGMDNTSPGPTFNKCLCKVLTQENELPLIDLDCLKVELRNTTMRTHFA